MGIDVAEIRLQDGFTSKELDPTISLYYGVYPALCGSARYYPDRRLFGRDPSDDSWRGRLNTIDPHAGLYAWSSPYSYAGDNPVSFLDRTGMDSSGAQNAGQQLSWFWNFLNQVGQFVQSITGNSPSQASEREAQDAAEASAQASYPAGISGEGRGSAKNGRLTVAGRSGNYELSRSTAESSLGIGVTAFGLSMEGQASTLELALKYGGGSLENLRAFELLRGGTEYLATGTVLINVGIAGAQFMSSPSWRSAANLSFESFPLVYPPLAIPVGAADILGWKDAILENISNERW